ncbi:hypothetical protein [Hamadaea tsunoensis]|uniref:hypothetical protein n=1 Tax=Hamadaea tsunoensis TaxID=53368 RepID=UPI0012FAF2F7|nr:hypothetical protein [Hamadaea tsunoensis]
MSSRTAWAVLGLAFLVAGCSTAPPESPAPTRVITSIVLDRTGGDVGLDDHLVLNPNGDWVYTDGKGRREQGVLAAGKTADAYGIASGKEFARELAAPMASPHCVDAPLLRLTVGNGSAGYVDCTDEVPVHLGQLVEILQVEILNKLPR